MISDQQKRQFDELNRRIGYIAIALAIALGVLVLRLWQLQIVEGEEYARAAEENRLHTLRLEAPRGMIFGRDGVVLADNTGAWDLVFVPGEADDPAAVCRRLGQLLTIDETAVLKKIDDNKKRPFKQIVVKPDLSKEELTRVEEYSNSLPGVLTVIRPKRRYAQGNTAGQLIGYLGEITKDQLEEKKPAYKMGDLIGKSGLEQRYENVLRGSDGSMLVNVYASDRLPQLRNVAGAADLVVDSYGRRLKFEQRVEPVNGGILRLTLDVPLQRRAEELLEGETGAIAILNAETGEVLALASAPSYDPEVFTTHGRNRERTALLTDKTKPMRSRCYQERYPPGSVFKIMMAAAALEDGLITPQTRFSCSGHFRLAGVRRPWRCWRWRQGGHGSVDVVDALAYSCDVFFYNVGLKLGPDGIKNWCDKMGLGVLTGIDLPGEVEGLIPSEAWKKSMHPNDPSEQRWYPGETVNLSIGQGSSSVTPLQTAVMMSCILNGGRLVQPYVNESSALPPGEAFIKPETLQAIIEGMRKCVEKDTPPSGTGRLAKIPGMAVLGKTGTAQVVNQRFYAQYANEEDIPRALRDHAWFVAGVMDRSPRIAIAVLIEHGLHGSSSAAPAAKELISFFYRDQPTPAAIAEMTGENELVSGELGPPL